MATLFYSPTQIKEDTTLSSNVDERYLTETILYCQDVYIQKLLGTTYFNELKGYIDAGTMAGAHKTLMDDYIRPCLKYYTLAEVLYVVSFPITNKGVVRRDGDHSTNADKGHVDLLKNEHINRAEWYAQRLIDYLCENDTNYPNYRNPGTGVDVIQPERGSGFSAGLFLGRSTGYNSLEEKYEDR